MPPRAGDPQRHYERRTRSVAAATRRSVLHYKRRQASRPRFGSIRPVLTDGSDGSSRMSPESERASPVLELGAADPTNAKGKSAAGAITKCENFTSPTSGEKPHRLRRCEESTATEDSSASMRHITRELVPSPFPEQKTGFAPTNESPLTQPTSPPTQESTSIPREQLDFIAESASASESRPPGGVLALGDNQHRSALGTSLPRSRSAATFAKPVCGGRYRIHGARLV